MHPQPPQLFHWSWVPLTWVDRVQDVIWIAFCLALLLYCRGVATLLADRESRRRAMLIGLVALGVRLLVPFVPINWYACVNNVDLGGQLYSRDNTYMPLPNQLMTFLLGFAGIVAFNILLGTASAILAWHVARRAGYGERVAFVFGLAVAVTPMYVRLSASDYTHMIALPLWWLAALAMQRLVMGEGRRLDQLVLFASAAVACPIRIEANLAMPAVALFVARDLPGLRRVWQARRQWWPFILGVLLGMACNVSTHGGSWNFMLGRFDILFFIIEMIASALFLVSPDPFGWIPLTYVLLIWYYLYRKWRQHDRAEVAATVLPFVIFSIPFAYTGKGMLGEALILPAATYTTCISMFLLLAAAKGAVLLYDRLQDGFLGGRPNMARAAVIVAAIALLGSFAIPYRKTYAYMEEFSFLSRSLPRQRARILTIFDATSEGGDYDCCLALPYPTFVADFPDLEWQVLGQGDADEAHLRDLQFDYYYPGSLVAVDVNRLNTWFVAHFAFDPEMNARQQAQLRRLQSIDEFIRQTYPLERYRQDTMPANTVSWAPFLDDRMTLTIYRRASPADNPR